MDAVRCALRQELHDRGGEIRREGQTTHLVVDDLGSDVLLGQLLHRGDEVVSITDDPTGTHDVVARHGADDSITGCLGLPIDPQRRIAFVDPVLGLFAVLHYLLLPQLAGAEKSISVLGNLNPLLAIVAVAAEVLSLAAYAQLARTLLQAANRPSFVAILRVQLATLGMSHVVPGGGTAATPLAFRLLRRAGIDRSDAMFVLSAQSIGSAAVLSAILLTALVVSIPLRGANPAYVVTAIVGTLITGGFAAVVIAIALKAQLQKPLVGKEGMIGEEGWAVTDISAGGRVLIRGEYWSASSDRPIEKGARIRVLQVDNLNVRVERIEP